jgi:hypothetical protein
MMKGLRFGTLLGAGRSGCSDIYNSSAASGYGMPAVDVAIVNIEDAVTQALQVVYIRRPAMLAIGVFNLAGADWPEDYQLLQSAMQTRCFGRLIQVQNETLGVLHAVSANNVGVTVVCGIGAATGARGYDGRTWCSSFWQKPQGSVHLSQRYWISCYAQSLGGKFQPYSRSTFLTSLADRPLTNRLTILLIDSTSLSMKVLR